VEWCAVQGSKGRACVDLLGLFNVYSCFGATWVQVLHGAKGFAKGDQQGETTEMAAG